jgi:hypothetical protein
LIARTVDRARARDRCEPFLGEDGLYRGASVGAAGEVAARTGAEVHMDRLRIGRVAMVFGLVGLAACAPEDYGSTSEDVRSCARSRRRPCGSDAGPGTPVITVDACVPRTCADLGDCGSQDDGCGGAIDCGSCESPTAPAVAIGPLPLVATDPSRGTVFASPTGSGTSCTLALPCDAWTAVARGRPGDVVFFRGGVYPVTRNLSFAGRGEESRPIVFESYPGELAIFDGSGLARTTAIYVRVTGERNVIRRIEVRSMPMSGIWIGGRYNTLEGVRSHHNLTSGIQIFSPYESFPYGAYGSYNVLRSCVVHDNSGAGYAAVSDGGDSDGISISSGEGNRVEHCLAYRNSDDGIDTWRSTNTYVGYSIAHDNGIAAGNGQGFKAGGASPSRGTVVEHSIAHHNRAAGFDYNSGIDVRFRYSTSYANAVGVSTGTTTVVERCIASADGRTLIGSGMVIDSSWQRAGTVVFESTDPSALDFLRPLKDGGFADIGAYAAEP